MNETQGCRYPPREGLRFFALWMVGLVVWKLCITALIWSLPAIQRGGLTRSWIRGYFATLSIVTLMLGVWQAWLLFVDRQRQIAWTCIAWLPAVASYFSRDALQDSVILYFSFCAPALVAILQSGLLIGIRSRPWLFALAIFISISVVRPLSETLRIGFRASAQGVASQFGISPPVAEDTLSNSAFLAVSILSAVALAWWMPPHRRVKRVNTPFFGGS